MNEITDKPWENLANAICEQAIRDFEWCISDRPLPQDVQSSLCNLGELKRFFHEQTLTPLNLTAISKKIEKTYKNEFRPFVEEHYQEIYHSWVSQKLDKIDYRKQPELHPYRCPNCGGLLRPNKKQKNMKIRYIVCTGCNLNVRMPEEFVRQINPETRRRKRKCST